MAEERKVIRWISYEETGKYTENIGGLGGWIDGHKWDEYIENIREELHPYYNALREDIVKKGITITGAEHQRIDEGVPLFDDNTIATFSYRGWGDLLAAIWNTEDDENYSYMEFYC